jgi:Spherulation-specific family 4
VYGDWAEVTAAGIAGNGESERNMKIIVPMYIYPGGSGVAAWQAVISQNVAVEYVIANPNSGPGAIKDNAYATIITACQSRGISVLGYVATTYAAKPMSAVVAEVKKYETFYAVDGVFYDEVSSGTDHLDYFAQLYRSTKGIVVLNPGTYPEKAYTEICDVLCVAERGVDAIEDRSVETADWMRGQPPDKFFYIIHSVPSAAQMRRILTKAQERNVGYCYITDDVLDNPFDKPPTYWNDECSLVRDLASTLSLRRS